jgi:hypothetical protein
MNKILKILLRPFKITFNPQLLDLLIEEYLKPKHMTKDLKSFQSTPFKIWTTSSTCILLQHYLKAILALKAQIWKYLMTFFGFF